MDDGTIAWMIRGGSRTETREAQLQRQHRAILTATDAATGEPGWRDRLSSWIGNSPAPAATPSLDCCPA